MKFREFNKYLEYAENKDIEEGGIGFYGVNSEEESA